jgi:hypothetical protein
MKKNPTDKVIRIGSADQLQELLSEPLEARFQIGARNICVPISPLSPATADQVRGLQRKARPPYKKDLGTNGDYDYFDTKYLEEKDLNSKKARAITIYCHCPAVAAKKPGLTNPDQIYQFVQTLFTENVLDVLAAKIMEGDLSLEAQVNFTSTPGSES